MAHNEGVFLPIWLSYCSSFFAPKDIYVLDHQSSDGSTAGGGFNRIAVEHHSFDNIWMTGTLEDHQHELLERYDAVLTTDVDEIVAPNPATGTLGDYIDHFEADFVNCRGYELLHMRDQEGPFAADRPVLAQRGYWYANGGYDKPALTTTPMRWDPGLHRRADGRFRKDPDLYLIHLHRMDYEICQSRHRRWRGRSWNQRDLDEGWGTHNRITEDAEFERWFYEDSCFEQFEIPVEPEPIPEIWRGLF
jgi:hypothetical protein